MNKALAEQAGGDERAAFERAFTVQEGIYFDDKRGEYRSMNLCAIEASDAQDLNLQLQGWQARAALAQPSPAQAEQAEVVAWRYGFSGGIVSDKACLDEWKSGGEYQSLMTVAQHERIVGALRFERQQMDRAFTACINERDAALARVAELERQEPVAHLRESDLERLNKPGIAGSAGSLWNGPREGFVPVYTAPVAQAQHSVPDGWVQSLPLKDHQPCKSNEDRANGYVIPIYSRPVPVEEALRKLRAVLCDPVGNVVIDGSDGDREEVQRALGMLAAAPAQGGE
ncbi:TPA: hypothetical protein NIB32_000499 [Pseudomonas aeruginosa]|nr:hypothetical protein [Pseudomonas aeruginosa]